MNRTTSVLLMLTIAASLILAACGSGVAQAPTAAPTPLTAILPTPSSVVPLDQRLLARIDIHEHLLATANMVGNYPDEIVLVQGFVWTRTANGHLIQVDPSTNTMVGAIKVDATTDLDHYCQGLGTDGENIWTCSARGENGSEEDNRTIDVVRIDPKTQSIIERFEVGKVFEQFDLPFLANQIWVLTGSGDKLIGIDVTTNQPGPTIDLGARCFQLAATDTALLATCALDNLVLQIDPEKGEVTARVSIQSPRNVAATQNGIWIAQDNAVIRLDPNSLDPIVAFGNLPNLGAMGDIFVTQQAVWVRQESGFLYRIDPVTNEVIEQIEPGESFTGGSVLVTSDSIWTSAHEDYLLFRISLK